MINKNNWFQVIVACLLCFVMLFIICFSIAKVVHSETYVVTVTEKSYSGDTDGYIIWCEDDNGATYEFTNKDELLRGKFNSGTIQGKLKEGMKYELEVIGWRIPFFSEYPNIIGYRVVK